MIVRTKIISHYSLFVTHYSEYNTHNKRLISHSLKRGTTGTSLNDEEYTFIKRIPRSLNLFQLFLVLDCAVLPCKGLTLHASLQIRFECLVICRTSILRSEKSIVCFGIFLRTIDPHATELYPK